MNNQKQEALVRIKMLGLHPNVAKELEKDIKYYSERQSKLFDGILYWIINNEKFVNAVKEFEEKTNNYVYHAQLTHFEFGDCLALMYVSNNEKEWKREREELAEGNVYCYVVNLDEPNFSEYGYVGIKPKNGGVTRIY